MAQHATYGPSKLELIEACPCYQSTPGDSDAALEGKLMHEAYEKQDVSILEDDEQRESVSRCLTYTENLGHGDGNRELRLRSPHTFGTIDFLGITGNRADIADAKFGRQLVTEANVNLQGQSYSHLAFHNFPEIDEVKVHFLAPRLDDISTCEYLRVPHNELIIDRIKRAIRRADDPESRPIPSEKACRWCANKADCPALGKIGLDVVKQAELGIPSPDFFNPGSLVTNEDRARAQIVATILQDWAEQVKKNNAQAVFEENLELEGFDLRTRAGGYKVSHAVPFISMVSEGMGIPLEEFHEVVSTTLSKVVDVVHRHVGGDKKAVKEQLLAVGGDLLEEKGPIRFLQRSRKRDIVEIWNEVSTS
jgi:hypothetical protein